MAVMFAIGYALVATGIALVDFFIGRWAGLW